MQPASFKTERLQIRTVQTSDKEFILQGLSDKRVTEFYAVHFNSLEEVQEQMEFYDGLIQNDTGIWWVISLHGDSKPIGACGLSNKEKKHKRAEIGFWLLPEHWGKGYMPEAVRAVISYSFVHLSLNRIEAIVEGGNTASEKVLQKLGFTYEGRLRESEVKNGRFIDLIYYSLLKYDLTSLSVKANQTAEKVRV